MRNIAVAMDLSERSDRAVERALRLAFELNAQCTVISIVDETLPSDMVAELRASTESRLRRTLDAHKGADALIDVRIGDVAPGVLGIAAEREADLLVLGLHRRRAFMDAVRETTMERIVAMCRQPVLLVRDSVDGPYRKVLVAVNLSKACAAAVSAAGRIAPGAEMTGIHALHVPFAGLTGGASGEMANAVRREVEELARHWQANHAIVGDMPLIETGGFHQVLDGKLQSFRPQLLAIGAHTRSGPGLHKLGSLAAELIRTPPVDLLVARG